MRRLGRMIGLMALAAKLVGCGESIPPPPKDDPRATWPAEVKEAESRFENQAKQGGKKAQ